MHQVKLFSTYECDRRYLEKSINDWLKANVDKTVADFQIQPIFLGGSVKLYGYILYKDNNQENQENQEKQEKQRNEESQRNINQDNEENQGEDSNAHNNL